MLVLFILLDFLRVSVRNAFQSLKGKRMNLANLTLAAVISFTTISSWGYHSNRQYYPNSNRNLNVAQSSSQAPTCMGNQGQALPVDDANVLQMKVSTKNSFLARAHVAGVISHLYNDATGHKHFQLKIGPQATDTLEVVYNEDFGKTSEVAVGAQVEACGDYITSNVDSRYKASPDGAIIHWVHRSPDLNRHASGFLIINGAVVGQSDNHAAYSQQFQFARRH